ncbi:MAG: hypothetical protein ACJAS1_005319 [Oleiphilaceae bacterium]
MEKEQSDVNDIDKIKDVVFELFDGKIGESFDNKELKEITIDGIKRYDNNIPPGYKDKKKPGSYFFEDKEYVRKFGDLILWKEIIQKAKKDKLKYVVLVTGDVKEDWWFEKRGKKLGPRKELLNEIYSEAKDLECFHMYDTSNFLQYAKNELGLNIQESSIIETKDLIELSRMNRSSNEAVYMFIPDYLSEMAERVSNLKLMFASSFYQLPLINTSCHFMYSVMMELFTNVVEHGDDNCVNIQGKEMDNLLVLKFTNKAMNSMPSLEMIENINANTSRGFGLKDVARSLQAEGIDIHITKNEDEFIAELFIPKSLTLLAS